MYGLGLRKFLKWVPLYAMKQSKAHFEVFDIGVTRRGSNHMPRQYFSTKKVKGIEQKQQKGGTQNVLELCTFYEYHPRIVLYVLLM